MYGATERPVSRQTALDRLPQRSEQLVLGQLRTPELGPHRDHAAADVHPTATGMIAPSVGITEPTVAPLPR